MTQARTRTVREALDSLMKAVRDDDMVPFEDTERPRAKAACRVVSSPGGRWVLAPDGEAKARHLADHPGDAVFTSGEIKRIEYDIRGFSKAERQHWLTEVIEVKAVLPDAEVMSVREVRATRAKEVRR